MLLVPPPVDTATNVPLPYATLYQFALVGSALCVAAKPAESLFCHWYESVPLGSATAVTANVAAPLLAVWLVGGDVIVIDRDRPLVP
jgi:hypothetical protein